MRLKAKSTGVNMGAGVAQPPLGVRSENRKAAGIDASIKAANQNRLRRIEGQVGGLQKMVDDDRYCPDIITQIASVQEALRGVARNLMKNHMHHCAMKAMRSGNAQQSEAMHGELLDLIYKHLR
jgi:DNA-binding FrmR family transcriptional regulator